MEYPDSKSKQFTEPMDKEQSELFLYAVLLEEKPDIKISENAYPFGSQVVKKRVEALKLPISFTPGGYLALGILSNSNPGRAVIALFDCLSEYEGKTVSSKDVADLYPWGFYNEDSCTDIIDNWMKPRKHKWAHIY